MERDYFKRLFLGAASLLTTGNASLAVETASLNDLLSPSGIEFSMRDLTPEEKVEMYLEEFGAEVIPVFGDNFEKIKSLRPGGKLPDINVLRVNYPFYRLAQSEFNIPWYILWLIHDEESTCSFDDDAFLRGAGGQYGAMQRASDFHPDSQVAVVAARFPILAKLPQKRAGDGREIMWAAQKLDSDAKFAMREDSRKDRTWGLADAVIEYSARTIGQARWEKIKVLDGIFDNS